MQYRIGIDQVKIGMRMTDEDKRIWEQENRFTHYVNFIGAMEYVGSVRSRYVFDPVPGQDILVRVGKKRAAWTAARQPLQLGGDIEVIYGRRAGGYFTSVRMNISKSHESELAIHLGQMADLGYETLHRHGRVLYCEFFMDIDGADFEDYLYLDPTLRSSHDGFVAAGTAYLGTIHSDRGFAAYDKAKELAEKSGVTLPHSRLRLEARLRGRQGFRADQFHNVANPFASLWVISKAALRACTAPSAARLLALVRNGRDAQAAYKLLTKKERREFRMLLPTLAAGWWNPDTMWLTYPLGLSWIGSLRAAGRFGEVIPWGDPIPYSGATIPSVDFAILDALKNAIPGPPSSAAFANTDNDAGKVVGCEEKLQPGPHVCAIDCAEPPLSKLPSSVEPPPLASRI